MDIATKFASGQEVVEAIFRKDKQPQGRQPEDVPEASAQRGVRKKGKKKSQAKRDATDADLVAAAEHRNPRKPPGGANLFDKKLKMSGPNGVITVGPTYQHAYECNVECVEYAEALAESEALIVDLESLSKEAPDAKRHAGKFKPAETVKSVPLDPSNDASKQIWIGSELDPK
jgi:FtsZ-interacting cell division protein YlmF